MSITISNCNQICNCPNNQSKAKMLYTFSKQPRFTKKIRVMCDNFYNLPDQTGRSTSLGYGNKYDFTKDVPKCPPPNIYQIESEFNKSSKKGVGFGEGREQMKVTGPFIATHKNKNPGPGTYQAMSGLNKTSYSISAKIITQDYQKIKIPGPGTYQTSFGLSSKGKYFLAKHKNSCVRNFNHFAKRCKTLKSFTPGPGKYNFQPQQMSPQGKYFLSNMQNSFSRRFGTSVRQPLAPKNNNPGPGNYKLPSQFGHYVAKNGVEPKQNKNNKLNAYNQNKI